MFKKLNKVSEKISGIDKELFGRTISTWLDRVSFLHIMIIWITAIVMFGLIYHFFDSLEGHLLYVLRNNAVDDLTDAIYFSFVTATTIGFGDIIPFGYFKIVAVIEVIFGLLLLSVVTYNLVSLKQDIISSEIYEISLNERISRLRTSLSLFRQNLDALITKVDDGTIKKRSISELDNYIVSLQHALDETDRLIGKLINNQFIKNIDLFNLELLYDRIASSFEKMDELFLVIENTRFKWKTNTLVTHLSKCISINEQLFIKLTSSVQLPKETIYDLNKSNDNIISILKNKIKMENFK